VKDANLEGELEQAQQYANTFLKCLDTKRVRQSQAADCAKKVDPGMKTW
jgi:hypothetical protein